LGEEYLKKQIVLSILYEVLPEDGAVRTETCRRELVQNICRPYSIRQCTCLLNTNDTIVKLEHTVWKTSHYFWCA
jgi:hypothetical protein